MLLPLYSFHFALLDVSSLMFPTDIGLPLPHSMAPILPVVFLLHALHIKSFVGHLALLGACVWVQLSLGLIFPFLEEPVLAFPLVLMYGQQGLAYI